MKVETAYSIGRNLASMKAIEDYVEDRTQEIYKMMAATDDVHQVYRYQGSIRELNRLLEMREIALKVVNQESLNGRKVSNK